jgi:hypothetical protein
LLLHVINIIQLWIRVDQAKKWLCGIISTY